MLRLPRIKSLAVCSAVVLGSVCCVGKALAAEMGRLTILTVEIDQSLIDDKLDKMALDVRTYLRRTGVTRRSKPVVTEDAVSVTILRPEELDLAEMVLSKLAHKMRSNGPEGGFEAFRLEVDRDTRTFTLRLTDASALKATRNLAERAARLGRCRVSSENMNAEWVVVSKTTLAVWVACSDRLVITGDSCAHLGQIVRHIRFEKIEDCEKTRVAAMRDLSC